MNERLQAIIELDEGLTKLEDMVAGFKAPKKPKPQTIYCGTEENVEFFKTIISTLGIDVEYEVQICNGEYEIVIQ